MRTVLAAVAAAALSTSLLGANPADAAPAARGGDHLPPQAGDVARAHARTVLDQASEALDGSATASGEDVSMALNQLMRVQSDLPVAERARAEALLARPTDGDSDPQGEGYTVAEAAPFCGATVCIHYVKTTADAPVLTDSDRDGVPNSVESALATAEQVNTTYVAAGYRRPKSDGTTGGGSGKVDIYLKDVGGQGLYGYCTSDDPFPRRAPYAMAAYCVIDDDFATAQFPTHTPAQNQQVTLAHEYFHAVQYAYDAGEDHWIMEPTATWAEDELFDAVDDNRQYLPYGQLGSPATPLDTFSSYGAAQYGNWIFFRYLSERFGARTGALPNVVLKMWNRMDSTSGAPDMSSVQAVKATLSADYGAAWKPLYLAFAEKNRVPQTYSEGSSYRAAKPRQVKTLTSGARSTAWATLGTKHLSSFTIRVRPGSGLWSRWKLRTNVDLGSAATGSAASVTVFFKNGSRTRKTIPVSSTGVGSTTLAFSGQNVTWAELTVVNSGNQDGIAQRFKFTALR